MQINSNFAEVTERDGNLRLLGFGSIVGLEGGMGLFQFEGPLIPHQRLLPLTHPRVQQMMFFGTEGFAKFMEAFAPKQPEQSKQIEELAP